MTSKGQDSGAQPSPFYCYAVPVAPQEGAHRAAVARLAELRQRSRWLVKLRWAGAAGVFAAVTFGRLVLRLPLAHEALYSTAALILLYNAGFQIMLRERPAPAAPQADLGKAAALAVLQIVADLLALTALVYFSGGVENPFFFYFVLHMVIASILFSRRASLWLATLAVALFSGLAVGQCFSILPHHRLWGFPLELHASTAYVFVVLATFASTMYLAVYFSSDIVEKLRSDERDLVSVTTSLEKGALELQEAYQKIKALEEKKSDVLRVASHQLRAPLAAIKSLLEVVAQGYTQDSAEQRSLLERARERTDGMLALTSELLFLSRLKDLDGLREKSAEAVDVCRLVAETGAFYRGRAEKKGLRFELSVPREHCVISASVEEIGQAVGNLIDNAILYTPPGGSVSCAVRADAGKVAVTVSDSGIGIGAGEFEKIFEEFYRSPDARSVNAGGTGLGLAIAKRAAEKWNGRISVESAPGRGTKFTLEFPAA